MKMNPKLLMVALGEEEIAQKAAKTGFWGRSNWGQVRSPGSSCEKSVYEPTTRESNNPTLQQGSVPNREADFRNPPTKGLSPTGISDGSHDPAPPEPLGV
jgi:hypothetical protein